MLNARVEEFNLRFKQPVRTSRGVIDRKSVYLLKVAYDYAPDVEGMGECSVLSGLSYDDKSEYDMVLDWLCRNMHRPYPTLMEELIEWPSIRFGLETAMIDLAHGGSGMLFDTRFTRGEMPICINGLVWMGDYQFMLQQIEDKMKGGYKVIKIKVGAIDFEKELELISHIRELHDASQLTIRLDANGAFSFAEALWKLERLAKYDIHSMEQPIKAGNVANMRDICAHSPIPIALDEELIGHHRYQERMVLMETIRPAYIILKPSLLGGFAACNEWIKVCNTYKVGYWITSALESNIGLNAIAQYTASLQTDGLAQGLGTGLLFDNNFPSRLRINKGELWYAK